MTGWATLLLCFDSLGVFIDKFGSSVGLLVFGLSMTFFLDAFGGVFVFFREVVELVVTGSDSGTDWASTSKATSTKLDGLVDEFKTLGVFFFSTFWDTVAGVL